MNHNILFLNFSIPHKYANIAAVKALYSLVIIILCCSSCTTIRPPLTLSDEIGYCHQVAENGIAPQYPEPIHTLQLHPSLSQRFSFKSLNMANAFGLLPLLDSLIKAENTLQASPSLQADMNLLKINQRLNAKLMQAHLEIAAMASEMDCEEERADQLAAYLNHKQRRTERRLTVAAIGVGAITGIVSGILLGTGRESELDMIGIIGGVTEVGLGLGILLAENKLEFYHERNPLRGIWHGSDKKGIFPPAVWYYLNYQDPAQSHQRSLREQLLERWQTFDQLPEMGAPEENQIAEIPLFFGQGGKYNADQLNNRADMFDQLESFINLMKQDLNLLMEELGY